MKRGFRPANFGIEYVLLLAAVVELSLNRLAVKTLRPAVEETPPAWHTALDHLGLFFQYFVSTLAVAATALIAWRLVRGAERPRSGLRGVPGTLLACFALLLALLAVASMVLPPSQTVSTVFQSFVALTLIVLAIDQLTAPGDLGAKLGVALLAVPLLLHFYPEFVFHFLGDERVRWNGLSFEFAEYGKWAVILVALWSPFLLAPRPIVHAVTRMPPLAVGVFVGVVGAVILRQHYEVGMELASRGIGVDIGPGAPDHHIALYVVALGAITWTLVSTLGASTESRRKIGVGIGLVVLGGYAFTWPFQYLLGVVGLFTISEAAAPVRREERNNDDARARGFRAPPIATVVWQRYVAALMSGMRDSEPSCRPTTVTVRGDEDVASTHVVVARHGVSVRLRIDRLSQSVLCIDVICGREAASGTRPDWTLYARPDRVLGARPHDEPPYCEGAVIKTHDGPFDSRFRVHDKARLTEALFDEAARSRATALLDGWMAYWSGRCLQYRVYPGRGAPLDHPVPITELAFRGESAAPAVDRLLSVIDLVVSLAQRADLSDATIGSSGEDALAELGLHEPEPGADATSEPGADATSEPDAVATSEPDAKPETGPETDADANETS